MLRTVRAQLEAFPGYVVVLAGMFAEMSNRTGLDIYYFRSFNGRCSGVTCGYLCQVEYPMGGRPIVYFWCVCFFLFARGEGFTVLEKRAGQPRTGDAAFADLLESMIGRDNIFRGKAPISYCSTFLRLVFLTFVLNY